MVRQVWEKIRLRVAASSLVIMSVFTLASAPVLAAGDFGWTLRSGPGAHNWGGIASSADGMKLVAGGNTTDIYTSTDGGVNWTDQTGSGVHRWIAFTSSADGTKLAALDAGTGNNVYTSPDSGVTWTAQTAAGTPNWWGLASSADGSVLVATEDNHTIHISTNFGVNWTSWTDPSVVWRGITSSADGKKLYAGTTSGRVYSSTDSGINWTSHLVSINKRMSSITTSADGTKVAAATPDGDVYTSTDSGVTWTDQTGSTNNGWANIASSADGNRLIISGFGASGIGGDIATSTDGGVTWATQTSAGSRIWGPVASSADGTKLAAVDQPGSSNNGNIWTASHSLPGAPTPASPTAGSHTSSTPTLTWNAGSGSVDHYSLQLSQDPTFASGVTTADPTGTSYASASLADGTWYWRVMTTDSFGYTGNWSATQNFIVGTAPGGTSAGVKTPDTGFGAPSGTNYLTILAFATLPFALSASLYGYRRLRTATAITR